MQFDLGDAATLDAPSLAFLLLNQAVTEFVQCGRFWHGLCG
jgi:hypothetical protein